MVKLFALILISFSMLFSDSMKEYIEYEYNGNLGIISITHSQIYRWNNYEKDYKEDYDIFKFNPHYDYYKFIIIPELEVQKSSVFNEEFTYFNKNKNQDTLKSVYINTYINYEGSEINLNIEIDSQYFYDLILGEKLINVNEQEIYIKLKYIKLHYAGFIELGIFYRFDVNEDYHEFWLESCLETPLITNLLISKSDDDILNNKYELDMMKLAEIIYKCKFSE